ncbi:hypothetical protein N7451_001115 [Penicillium sp. IBT 35674x]|nr:hypothetical protein N7451_001115 [Penicillium sp. IBT 35674x]
MVAALEDVVIVPGAGEEAFWLQDNLAVFKKQVDDYDDDFKGSLKEIGERDGFKETDTVEVRARLLLSSSCGGRLLSTILLPHRTSWLKRLP